MARPTYYPANDQAIKGDVLEEFKKKALINEEQTLFSFAAFSKGHERKNGEEIDHRLPYKRDVDRIVHSKAYARYIDKTQVVYLVENDHITQRGLHVQLVSNFARGIAEILRLNLDLVEAISLGHDVGHPPFGHEGEGYLSELAIEYGNGAFAHPWQSCRLYSEIEPLNLGLNVLDGFLCHDGGLKTPKLEPRFGKTWDDHMVDKNFKITDPDSNIIPGTLEGCLVKISDTISYLGRDVEDALSLGILKREQIPKTILGTSNREFLSVLSRDIIKMSYDQPCIALSDEAFEALLTFRKFNFENIYMHPKLKVESNKVKMSYRILFEHLLKDLKKSGSKSYIGQEFLENKTNHYRKNTDEVQVVVDFISGMTDNFFVKTLQKLVVPMQIELLK